MTDNNIVKYHNDFNRLSMKNWNIEEIDMLFSLITKISEKGTNLLKLNTDELKILTGTETRNSYWYLAFKNFIDKASVLRYIEDDGKNYGSLALFSRLKYDEKKTLEVKVSDEFEYIVNNLDVQFSSWELEEFTSIRSTYLKTMYRNIKQWKKSGNLEWSIEKFRIMLEIPDSYRANNIDERIIKPMQKEFSNYFCDFKIKTIKSNKQGTPVIGYKFSWKPEKSSNQKWIKDKYNKKSNTKSLAEKDNRMSKAEREEYVNKKLKQKLPIKKISNSDEEEIQNIEGQIFVEEI